MTGLTREDGDDVYEYEINLNPFFVTQNVNGEVAATTSSLYFEDRSSSSEAWSTEGSTCFDGLRSRAQERSGLDIYANSAEKKQSVSWGIKISDVDTTFYGIPEREDTLTLKETKGTDPYKLFATDHLHAPNQPGPLYGSIPYVMGLNEMTATSLLWVNSAKTLVDVDRSEDGA